MNDAADRAAVNIYMQYVRDGKNTNVSEMIRTEYQELVDAAKLLSEEGICPANWKILRAALKKVSP